MSKELELYKAFIDGLVERKDSMMALWVKGDGFPKTEDNKAKNELLATLTPEQMCIRDRFTGSPGPDKVARTKPAGLCADGGAGRAAPSDTE